ncbi:phosphoribosylanthranilate isomerase [Staphylococcus gallinarum]|uniref:phosphoribosylanthranilate isomerase n=1 Tax=Staphylococcus gallinarum TaxID=1293 RepID=UPI000D1C9C9F|nr:phosphoribosylanthranilate isomerase [Staphylococcus gallinarum]MBU7216287.1 phosphoribosylanthranilate isomerase [Staphylococcus gallinarum]MCD8793006.1 phosphoribosylanthranilate isomerase [Staphylococcus gallinarum]MCD8828277.1 phosphoribosylanthranilate isomerase [Staphylococcus gallinarum]MCD8919533.1 phosphoribosylanthranilate isomerase [Staphylococcus gallinarum]MDN6412625.1 phosphoribosylanthranilate isomerase [Staphylococcus gallinarum]
MKLKFCGFKTLDDVEKAKNLNIDAIGFIHYPKSKRFVDVQTINQFTQLIPDDKEKVVIVVNPSKTTISDLITHTGITTIQLHGDETLATINYIKQIAPQLKIIKALPAKDLATLQQSIIHYQQSVDLFIIDTPSEDFGGTGKVYDWSILKSLSDIEFLIAGGINLENIKKIEQLNLNHVGYDIASGIETDGVKDSEKMYEIIEYVKGVQQNG